MLETLALTIISDDRPGIVEQLAHTIHQHEGNWLEGRMSQLAGKFAGILRVSVPATQRQTLQQALQALAAEGIKVYVETLESPPQVQTGATTQPISFTLMGTDRPGIVHQISRAFADTRINVLELETRCSSMPWSGDPLFEAEGILALPEGQSLVSLEQFLEPIAHELGLDIALEPLRGKQGKD